MNMQLRKRIDQPASAGFMAQSRFDGGRAAWIGVLLSWWRVVLGALAPAAPLMFVIVGSRLLFEAMARGSPGHGRIPAGNAIAEIVCGLLAGACFWLATRPSLPPVLVNVWQWLPGFVRWPIWRALLTLHVLWLPWGNFVPQLHDAFVGIYHNDAVAYIHVDADLLRQGQNPYTADKAFWVAAQRYPKGSATPLLGSQAWGNDPLAYPKTPTQIKVLLAEVASPAARGGHDFDPRTVHNYPAGVIWLVLPLIWAGLPSIIPLSFLMVFLILLMILARAPVRERPAALVAFIASPVLFLSGMIDNFDSLALVFVLAAWHFLDRRRLSPLLLGIGAAIKQTAWFFIPFYLVETYRREGPRAALIRAGWVAAGFLAPNLPFILLAPRAWFQSLLLPVTDPMFPIGYGAISLALGGIVPARPQVIWTILELMALLGLLIYLWRRRAVNSDGLILALVPLWFAWRSPMDYFAFLPTLVLWLALAARAPRAAPVPEPTPKPLAEAATA